MANTKTPNRRGVIAYVGLGSNLGDRQAMLERAVECLRQEAGVRVGKVSSFYNTAAVGGPAGQADYLNGVVEILTGLDAETLLARLLSIENRLGRQRKQRWEPRCIDLDLLLYGQEIIKTEDLQVPHERMHQREFVLRGLKEIAPQVRHPASGKTAEQMWRDVAAEHKGE